MTPMEAFYEAESTSIIKHLERRGMEGYYCPTSAEAVSLACFFHSPGLHCFLGRLRNPDPMWDAGCRKERRL